MAVNGAARNLSRFLFWVMLMTGSSAHAAQVYWNVFNVEGESSLSADIVTYGALSDMLTDSNRNGVFTPNPTGFGTNIIGSGSDGSSYWNVFNVEGESSLSADIVTYGALSNMLTDSNRTGVFTPNPTGFGTNIVGSGAYWAPDEPSPVPVPASMLLLVTALGGLLVNGRFRRAAVDQGKRPV